MWVTSDGACLSACLGQSDDENGFGTCFFTKRVIFLCFQTCERFWLYKFGRSLAFVYIYIITLEDTSTVLSVDHLCSCAQ